MREGDGSASTTMSGDDIVRALAEAASAEHAVRALLGLVASSFDWATAELWLIEEEDGLLRAGGDWSLDAPELVGFRELGRRLSFARGVGLPGRAWSKGEPVWVADLEEDENFPRWEAAKRAELRSAVAVPVRGPRGLLGVIAFFARDRRQPNPRQLQALRTAARQMGFYLAGSHAAERLRSSEEISGSIFEAALDCIITMDHRGRVVELNRAAEVTFGYSRDEVRGRQLAALIIPEEFRAAHQRARRRYLETGQATILDQRLELTAMRSDGSRLPVELTVTRLGTHEPPTFAGFVRDLTDRRRADERIAQLLGREHEARIAAEASAQAARRVSETLQRSLLPPHLPEIPGVRLAAAYDAADQSSMVGGDFYDVFPVAEDRWGVVVGDVSGKGADAASLTALARYTLRTAAVQRYEPRAVLAIVNDAFLAEPRTNAYCTLAYATLSVAASQAVIRLAVAGHPTPLLIGRDALPKTVGRTGTMLGAADDATFEDVEVVLEEGDTLLLYTDGVTEAHTPHGRLGLEGLLRMLKRGPARPPQDMIAGVVRGLHGGEGHRVTDDVALLAVHRPLSEAR